METMFRVLNSLSLEYDWRLVALAGVVCFLASLTAISLYHRAGALKGRARLTWLLIAGLATGCGMWTTHFIAMLAFKPGFAISYDLSFTLMSLLVAIAASALGFAWAVYGTWRERAAVGGAVIGLGAAAMHFIGMNGLEMPGYIVWSAGLVVAAIALGAAFGAAALGWPPAGATLPTSSGVRCYSPSRSWRCTSPPWAPPTSSTTRPIVSSAPLRCRRSGWRSPSPPSPARCW